MLKDKDGNPMRDSRGNLMLDAERPFLEQFEEAAFLDPQGPESELLTKVIYPNPELLSELTPIRLPSTSRP